MKTVRKNNKEYKAIRAWSAMLGSFAYYTESQVAEAQQDDAPDLAIYKDQDTGRWSTLDQVTNKQTRFYFISNYTELAKQAGFIE